MLRLAVLFSPFRWAWLIYAGVVLCCICPMLFFFFKWRRDKEAELDTYGGGSGKT